MDYDKLYDLTGSVRTWSEFILGHAIVCSNYACMLANNMSNISREDIVLFYKNEFYFLKENMEDLILKYKELEKFYNENFEQKTTVSREV